MTSILRDPSALRGGGVCLLMIVRNESAVISRCLESVLPHIDSWCIVDTGSTDGTQGIIRRELSEIPGELHEREWVNFGHNRTEAFHLAPKSAWYLLIDADETFHGELHTEWLNPSRGYNANIHLPGQLFQRVTLIPRGIDWHWVGRVDERIEPNPYGLPCLEGCWIESHEDGGRHRSENWLERDIDNLQLDYIDFPHPRTAFHLAQRLHLAGRLPEALAWHLKHANMPGAWDVQAQQSLYDAADIALKLGHNEIADKIRASASGILAYNGLRQYNPLGV